MSTGPNGLNEDFVRGLPDAGPVVMVNFLRFKAASVDGDGSGWDAYTRYSKGFATLMKAVGATILWGGKVEGAAFGDVFDVAAGEALQAVYVAVIRRNHDRAGVGVENGKAAAHFSVRIVHVSNVRAVA